MTAAGVKAYRRLNPGSKLKTAVTGKVKLKSVGEVVENQKKLSTNDCPLQKILILEVRMI